MKPSQEENNKSTEKPSDKDKKANKAVLFGGGILVAALIISMFVDGGSRAPAPLEKQVEMTTASGPYSNSSGFDDKSQQYDKIDFTAEKFNGKGHANDQVQVKTKPYEAQVNKAVASWQGKENVRHLNSRKVGFGFEVYGSAERQHTDRKQDRASDNGVKIATANRLSRANVVNGEAGENIVGHAVDDVYKGAERNGEVLVPTGTVIKAVLDQDVNSDYTGPWQALVRDDIYDTKYHFVLIPKGTKLIGQSLHITNVNEPIQNRMGLTVEWAVLPNGKRIDFTRQAVQDRAGISGIKGDVNRHLLWQFGGVAAYALLSASMPHEQAGYQYQPTFNGQLADGVREQVSPMVSKYLSLVPTVKIKAGTPITVFIKDDLYIKPWSRVNKTVYTVS